MKKFLFVMFAGIFAIAAAAQEQQLVSVTRPVFPGEVDCRPLFIVSTNMGTTPERVLFSYQKPDGSVVAGNSILKSQVVVNIRMGPPTYQRAMSTDGSQEGAIFRMTQDDYNRASACLPPPKK